MVQGMRRLQMRMLLQVGPLATADAPDMQLLLLEPMLSPARGRAAAQVLLLLLLELQLRARVQLHARDQNNNCEFSGGRVRLAMTMQVVCGDLDARGP